MIFYCRCFLLISPNDDIGISDDCVQSLHDLRPCNNNSIRSVYLLEFLFQQKQQQQQQQQQQHQPPFTYFPAPNSDSSSGHGWLPLLHIPADRGGGGAAGLRFPPLVPPPAWPEQGVSQGEAMTLSGLPYMPLLRASSSTSDPQRYEQPERDPGLHPLYQPAMMHQQELPHDAYQQLPLLHANWSQTPFMNLRDQYAVPRLVPPEQLLDYEQRRYKKQNQRKQQLQAEIDEQLRQSATARPATPLGAKLLKADLEPFNERDERDNEARCVFVMTTVVLYAVRWYR